MVSSLTPGLILGIVLVYFVMLIGISLVTAKKTDSSSFFLAGRNAPWLLVAIGMIGTSISGVTFVSTPGVVGGEGLNMSFSYLQVVFGYRAHAPVLQDEPHFDIHLFREPFWVLFI